MLRRLPGSGWLPTFQVLAVIGAAFLAPAAAQNTPGADKRGWPGGLPNGWRMLGDDEGPAPPTDAPPPPFDFGRDGQFLPPRGQSANPLSKNGQNGAAKQAAPDDQAAKAARIKARADQLKKALAPKPEPAILRQQALDELFKHLSAASDPDEAKGYAEAIKHIWMQSQSDTARLIMQRATQAAAAKNYPLSLSLLDRLVALEPDWAEAWNQRAAVRFLMQDSDGAMADIDMVMKLEPRHFGALMGMGVILQRAGLDKRALQVFNKALEIYPAQPSLKDSVEKLSLDVNGRDI
jgi:tetratricopeptide (TPR) repeat protein